MLSNLVPESVQYYFRKSAYGTDQSGSNSKQSGSKQSSKRIGYHQPPSESKFELVNGHKVGPHVYGKAYEGKEPRVDSKGIFLRTDLDVDYSKYSDASDRV